MRLLPICPAAVNQTADKAYYFFDGYAHFAAGLACGLAGLGAGMAIGIVGDAGVRANAQQPKLFVGMILILIFAEALALYGLIGELASRQQRQHACMAVELASEAGGVWPSVLDCLLCSANRWSVVLGAAAIISNATDPCA